MLDNTFYDILPRRIENIDEETPVLSPLPELFVSNVIHEDSFFDEKEINLVMLHANVSRDMAIFILKITNGDIVNAIFKLTM